VTLDSSSLFGTAADPSAACRSHHAVPVSDHSEADARALLSQGNLA
jgi:hypothetical protein